MYKRDTSVPESGDSPGYRRYREFWQNNLQSIDEMASSLRSSIASLEKEYAGFDVRHEEIQKQMDILAAMYSSYNVISGKEYILKLRALLKESRRLYSHGGANFNAIHYVQQKIDELRDESFSGYPALSHDESEPAPAPPATPAAPVHAEATFHWITFERNGFRFITAYDTCRIHNAGELRQGTGRATGQPVVTPGTPKIEITDMLPPPGQPPLPARHYIITGRNDKVICYAADRIYKTIHSWSDVISHVVRPVRAGTLRLGTLRIFGHRHFYIY